MKRKLRLYIACALTKAPPELKAKIARLKAVIKERHPEWEVLEFYGLGQGVSDGTVFLYDVKQVMSADLIVAVTDVDSTGLGEEAGIALALGLPLLFAAHADWTRTRMVTGPAEAWPQSVMFERYDEIEGITTFIEHAVGHFKIDLSRPRPSTLSVADHVQEFYRTEVLEERAPAKTDENTLFMKEAPIYADNEIFALAAGSSIQAGYESSRGSGWKS